MEALAPAICFNLQVEEEAVGCRLRPSMVLRTFMWCSNWTALNEAVGDVPAALWGWRLDQQRDVICFNGLCKRLLDRDRTVHERLNGEVCVVSFPAP